MRRSVAFLAVLVVVLWAVVGGQTQQAPVQGWEYAESRLAPRTSTRGSSFIGPGFQINYASPAELYEELASHYGALGGSQRVPDIAGTIHPVDVLNVIGNGGWELVSAVRLDDFTSYYYFKRPRQ